MQYGGVSDTSLKTCRGCPTPVLNALSKAWVWLSGTLHRSQDLRIPAALETLLRCSRLVFQPCQLLPLFPEAAAKWLHSVPRPPYWSLHQPLQGEFDGKKTLAACHSPYPRSFKLCSNSCHQRAQSAAWVSVLDQEGPGPRLAWCNPCSCCKSHTLLVRIHVLPMVPAVAGLNKGMHHHAVLPQCTCP